MKFTLQSLVSVILFSITLVHASPVPVVPDHAANGVEHGVNKCAHDAENCLEVPSHAVATVESAAPVAEVSQVDACASNAEGCVATTAQDATSAAPVAVPDMDTDTDIHAHCKVHPSDVKCKGTTRTTQEVGPASHVASTSDSKSVHTKECIDAAEVSTTHCDEVKVVSHDSRQFQAEVQALVDEELEDVEDFERFL